MLSFARRFAVLGVGVLFVFNGSTNVSAAKVEVSIVLRPEPTSFNSAGLDPATSTHILHVGSSVIANGSTESTVAYVLRDFIEPCSGATLESIRLRHEMTGASPEEESSQRWAVGLATQGESGPEFLSNYNILEGEIFQAFPSRGKDTSLSSNGLIEHIVDTQAFAATGDEKGYGVLVSWGDYEDIFVSTYALATYETRECATAEDLTSSDLIVSGLPGPPKTGTKKFFFGILSGGALFVALHETYRLIKKRKLKNAVPTEK